MPELRARIRRLAAGSADAAILELAGFIDASTHAVFQKILERVQRLRVKFAILNFRGVAYINSSGIMALLQGYRAAKEQGREWVIVEVPKAVGWSMHLLGLPEVIPFLRNESDAGEYFKSAGSGPPVPFFSYLKRIGRIAPQAKARYVLPLRASPAKAEPASVLLVVSRPDHFSDIVRRRLLDPRGRFFLVHTCVEARRSFDEMKPDVVILDDRVRYAEEFLHWIKIQRGRGLVSVVKLYPTRSALDEKRPFKIWENDYLIEPFEIMELFLLAETELRRTTRSRGLVLHQAHFQLQGTPKNVKEAATLLDGLLSQSGLTPESRGIFHAALLEAMDNGIRHGNKKDPRRLLDVRFLLDPEKVTVTIEDEGDGFDFRSHLDRMNRLEAAEVALRERRHGEGGGLGILMMVRASDRLDYDAKGRRVRLEKRRDAPETAA